MKIGLLTYYGDLNCGTNLQAYASLLALREMYPHDEVEVIPFHGFRPEVRPYKSLSPASIWRDCHRIAKYARFRREHLGITGRDPIITDVDAALRYIAGRKYDKIYVGADTLLELDRTQPDRLSAYWLHNIAAEKILLAASAKNVTYESLSPRQREEMSEAVAQMSHLGVRDSVTHQLISHFAPEERIKHVPDPTFTLDIDHDITAQYLHSKGVKIPPKSVFMHLYGDDTWAQPLAKHFRDMGYYIVTPRPYKHGDLSLNDMGPLEQLGIYSYFQLVVTHRFHDCVFSLKNGTPCWVYVKSRKTFMTHRNESKHISLLKEFGLYPQGFLGCVDDGIDTTNVEARVQELKQQFAHAQVGLQLKVVRERYRSFVEQTRTNEHQ